MAQRTIEERVQQLLASLPEGTLLVAAAKTRTVTDVLAAVQGGIRAIGHNYVQEAEAMRGAFDRHEAELPEDLRWHFIGHLQRNKARKAAALFDTVETLDSLRTAAALSRHCVELGKVMSVFIEINSGREDNKSGVLPEEAQAMARGVAELPGLHLQGVMTMGPIAAPDACRPCFRLTREVFEEISHCSLAATDMRYLSMGMSGSYVTALEEGANVVRIGTGIFGSR